MKFCFVLKWVFVFVFSFLCSAGCQDRNTLVLKEPGVVKSSVAFEAEKQVLQKRLPLIKKSVEMVCNTQLEDTKIPRIAVCASGGCLRAMVATAGLLDGLQEIGLLDSISYLATLSGSTLTVVPWILEDASMDVFVNGLTERLESVRSFSAVVDLLKDSYKDYCQIREQKEVFGQEVNTIDFYGAVITRTLLPHLHEQPLEIKLSDLAKNVETGRYPLPIFTGVSILKKDAYEWIEFNPFYVGSRALDCYVKTSEFGRRFCAGYSLDDAPEPSIGFSMAIFGSALSASLLDICNQINRRVKAPEFLKRIIEKIRVFLKEKFPIFSSKKMLPPRVNNFARGMNEFFAKDTETLDIVDGGYLCGIPVGPMLQKDRGVSIIIILDSMQERILKKNVALQEAEQQAKEKGFKFPPIDYEKAKNQNFSVFKDEQDSECPVVVYIPLKKDESYDKDFDPAQASFCKGTNFFYSKEQFSLLFGLIKHVVKSYKEDMFGVIRDFALAGC